ncbi:MAG TPA: hypothetical protein VLX28_24925 [Thermoanaerobaculia bacterium]|nr:hypothetical protein [Thermoanaerobaculia bacterium]
MLRQFRNSYLTAPVFVRRAYTAMAALDGDEYRARGAGVKELVEEAMPLAALLKHLENPELCVLCKYVGGNANHDARLRLSGVPVDQGFFEKDYFVEVTSALSPLDFLRREALTSYGSVFGGPEIKRVRSRKRGVNEIVSQAAAQDMDSPLLEAITWVKERLSAKAEKQYPQPCILVVNVEPDRPLGLEEWAALARGVSGNVDRTKFKMTFIVEWYRNTAFLI